MPDFRIDRGQDGSVTIVDVTTGASEVVAAAALGLKAAATSGIALGGDLDETSRHNYVPAEVSARHNYVPEDTELTARHNFVPEDTELTARHNFVPEDTEPTARHNYVPEDSEETGRHNYVPN